MIQNIILTGFILPFLLLGATYTPEIEIKPPNPPVERVYATTSIKTQDKVVDRRDERTKVIDTIIELSQEYGVDTELALDLAWFESRYNPRARNQEGSSAKGIYQFVNGTWGYCDGDVFNYEDNIRCAMEFLSEPNGIKHWMADDRVERYLINKGHL